LDGLTRYAGALATRVMPERPFVLLGQMTTSDASRSPEGTESAWAYTHIPEGIDYTEEMIEEQAGRVEAAIEAHAPGFGDLILARQVQSPAVLHDANPNLVNGAVGAGTAGIHQQLIFRPVVGLGRAETPIDGLYLAGAAAHPGGGVHGGPGGNAAVAALRRAGLTGRARRRVLDAIFDRIYR
jgi:phytoene dehydrogenase-like protein